MRIGLDIDNVISNFDEVLLKEFMIHDKEIRNSGIVNKDADYITKGMFDWHENELNEFYKNNIERISKSLDIIDGAKEYINKLKEEGYEIYIITGRDNGEYVTPYNMTKEWLEVNKISYDKLILTNYYKNDKHGKTKECIENNIEIMIDDSINICKDCIENGINAILMDTQYNKKENKVKRVFTWKEIYNYIKNYKKDKLNVILDTDTYNECDDEFALAYMLKSQDVFNIEAITIAPYSHNDTKGITVIEGQEKSYNEILKICNWLNFDAINKVFKGSNDYMQNGYTEENDAVNKIIEISLKNDKTYIMAIGAITNVALAIQKEPKIISRIEIIWLGGHSLLQKNNLEYNFKQDVQAVKIVFSSKVKLTVIPCKNVASNLRTSIYELNYYLKDKSELCNYLIDRFCNDGYHETKQAKILWDISVIGYMINKSWFDYEPLSLPIINEDTSYTYTSDKNFITMVNYMDADKIYIDLFKKLGYAERSIN